MNYQEIIKNITARKFAPIYFLMGEEAYYIDKVSDLLEDSVLSEEEKAFNQMVMYGKDVDIEQIITAARRYPMMAPYQVLFVKEAQEIRKIETLAAYAEKPTPTTILVICYRGKSLDGRTALMKTLKKNHVVLESKALYENQVQPWISSELKQAGYSIEPKANAMLVEFLGTDLSKISNELQKLQLVISKGSTITAADIERNIGISKDYNNFELTNAMSSRDGAKALRIVKYFEKNPSANPFVLTLMVLYGFYSKLLLYHYEAKKMRENELATRLKVHPYFLKEYRTAASKYSVKQTVEILGLLRVYDMKSKGVDNSSVPDGQLLKELVFKIFYTR